MKTKLSFVLCVVLMSWQITSYSQTITNCRNPAGYAYFHHSGLISKKESGFQTDKITGGITSFVKLSDGKFDINIVDIRKQIISFTQDGGRVVLLRSGKNDATFLHFHQGMVIELYSFWVENDGKNKFSMIQSKGGDNMLVHKSSVLVGDCDAINFELIRN
jgi:hypothetical protein